MTALASDGVASERVGRPCEDTITLAVRWRNKLEPPALQEENQGREGRQEGAAARSFTGSAGHAVYTSSWIAARADVHSQQRWLSS